MKRCSFCLAGLDRFLNGGRFSMARIPEEEIERLKQTVSGERLVEARGVRLQRHGAELLGRGLPPEGGRGGDQCSSVRAPAFGFSSTCREAVRQFGDGADGRVPGLYFFLRFTSLRPPTSVSPGGAGLDRPVRRAPLSCPHSRGDRTVANDIESGLRGAAFISPQQASGAPAHLKFAAR